MLKILKQGFNSTWTVNFQMFKLDLEKAEQPETKLPTSVGSDKNQGNSNKFSKFSKPGINSTWTMNFQMFKLGLEKAEGTRDQIANVCWIIEKAREFQKKHLLLHY